MRFPDKVAIIDGDTRLSFREFDGLVARLSSALLHEGVAKGDRLAVLSHNCWEFAVLAFATARIGVILVPINFMLGSDEISYILKHSGASVFVVEDALVPVADDAVSALGSYVSPDRIVISRPGTAAGRNGWRNINEWFFSNTRFAPPVDVSDDDPIRLMYTSGTESRPKGVLLSSRSLMWQYVSCVIDGSMSASDIELHALPLYHCAQLDCFLEPDIYLGATSVLLRGADAATILRTIESEQITKFFAPPTVWISLLRHPTFDSTDLTSLRKGYYGASPMPVEVLKEIQRRLPGVQLWNFYGQTEMSPVATILGPAEQLTHAGSAGRAALNVETAILDDLDQEVPAGTVGEIAHRSPHATLGYYRNDEKTAEAFRNGWFHSGDLGYLDEAGRLTVVDRKKDMIKSGGENVASREVEEAIYLLEGVAEVAVFGVSHPHWVEAVAAEVVLKPGSGLTEQAIIDHSRSVLAKFKAPKYVIISDSLPKNPSGKIVKRQLREKHTDIALD